MPLLAGLPLLALDAVHRLARWVIYADCTCEERSVLDCDHGPDCPHPLLKRQRRVPPRPAQTRDFTIYGRDAAPTHAKRKRA